MPDDVRVQDGVPVWGTPAPPQAEPVEPLVPAGTAGPPAWGTAQRPRGAARRTRGAARRSPTSEPSGWHEVKLTGLGLLGALAVAVPTVLAIALPEDRADRVQAHGTTATATVLEVRQWVGVRDVALRYAQDGQWWTVHRGTKDSTPSWLGVGDSLDVWVDPQDPGWASAQGLDPFPAWMSELIFVGFLVSCGALAMAVPMFVGALARQVRVLVRTWYRRRVRREPRPG